MKLVIAVLFSLLLLPPLLRHPIILCWNNKWPVKAILFLVLKHLLFSHLQSSMQQFVFHTRIMHSPSPANHLVLTSHRAVFLTQDHVQRWTVFLLRNSVSTTLCRVQNYSLILSFLCPSASDWITNQNVIIATSICCTAHRGLLPDLLHFRSFVDLRNLGQMGQYGD